MEGVDDSLAGARAPGSLRRKTPALDRLCPGWKLARALMLSVLLLAGPTAPRAAAANHMLVLLRDTFYGSMLGVILSGALTLVVPEDDRQDVLRWGVVIGTFSGFGFGVYEVTREDSDVLSEAAVGPMRLAFGQDPREGLHPWALGRLQAGTIGRARGAFTTGGHAPGTAPLRDALGRRGRTGAGTGSPRFSLLGGLLGRMNTAGSEAAGAAEVFK